MNVLFLGIDTTQNLSQTDMPGEAGQSDCILVLSMDKQKKRHGFCKSPVIL